MNFQITSGLASDWLVNPKWYAMPFFVKEGALNGPHSLELPKINAKKYYFNTCGLRLAAI